MPYRQPDSVRYYTFESLDAAGLTHAVFTRQGGVSPAPWQALNVGGTVGDEPSRVRENRRRAFLALGCELESLYDVWQVHSAEVVIANAPRPPDSLHRKADAILTNQPGVTLFMRFADCVPIFLYDPRRKVIGIAHAGWKGTVSKVASAAVEAMQAEYGSRTSDVLAAIGPSIAAHHYEIGLEVVEQVRGAFGQDADDLLHPTSSKQEDRLTLDLWKANHLILERAGVRAVEEAGICTACQMEDWYSHRGEHGKTGRFGALVALKG